MSSEISSFTVGECCDQLSELAHDALHHHVAGAHELSVAIELFEDLQLRSHHAEKSESRTEPSAEH